MHLARYETKHVWLLFALLQIFLISKPGVAQTLSTPTQQTFETEAEELYLPPESGRLKLDLSEDFYNAEYLGLNRLPEKIDSRQIKFIGNTIFSTEELSSLVDLEQQAISQNDLRLLIQKINRLYQDNGYVTSGIYDEPKIARNGVIFIPITEGKIEEIKISGLDRLRDCL